jgi:predicted permease
VIVIQSIFIVFLSLINHKEKSITKKLIGIISTPLVIMPIIGLFLNIWSIEPHPLMISIIKTLGVGSPSLALFSFGLTLGSVKIKKETITREILWIVFLKNFLHPFIAFCVGKYAFDLEEYWLYSLVIATSAPTAFVVYILGKQFSKDTHWMKTVLAITAIISAISLVMISLIKGAF